MLDTVRSTANLQTTLDELFESLQTKSLATLSGKQYSSTGMQGSTWCKWLHFSKSPTNIPTYLPYLRLIAGATGGVTPEPEILPPPYSRNLAISRDIIGGCLDTALPSYPDTSLRSPGCGALIPQLTQNLPSHQRRPAPSHLGASVLGFFFLLRKSEYLAQRSTVQTYAVHRSDVKFIYKGGREVTLLLNAAEVVFQFRGSKADQFGVCARRTMAMCGYNWCCPVLAAWFLTSHQKSLCAGPNTLLCKVDANNNLQVRDMVKAIKQAAKLAGHDPANYVRIRFVAAVHHRALHTYQLWSDYQNGASNDPEVYYAAKAMGNPHATPWSWWGYNVNFFIVPLTARPHIKSDND
ncbi:hypothetical protein PHMEG_00013165 [Phytophthora megakarya]|uniref:Uncharacterized protein n=1 Tax=Phytophthora megakarya TaxID=4795 RepID=A0A225W7D4_9STRA|nr:hypothetical protein PHMEG_00013165 [Phytophthora megakarya]